MQGLGYQYLAAQEIQIMGCPVWSQGGVSLLWPQSPVHDCCGVKGQHCWACSLHEPVGGTQDSPDPRCQPAAGISWQKGGTQQALFTCPLSDIPDKEIIVLKRGFFTSVSACWAVHSTIPVSWLLWAWVTIKLLKPALLNSGTSTPRAAPQLLRSTNIILGWAVICWDLVKPFSSGEVWDWVALLLLYSLQNRRGKGIKWRGRVYFSSMAYLTSGLSAKGHVGLWQLKLSLM